MVRDRKKLDQDDEALLKAEEILADPQGPGVDLVAEYRALSKHYRSLLRKLNKTLSISDQYQLQLKELSEQLAETVTAAESASRAKSGFLSTMSHELRTPLNTVIGLSELAQEVRDPERVAEYLAMINTAAESLLDLVNDILDFSRIEADRLVLEQIPFPFTSLLGAQASLFGLQARRKGLSFTLTISPSVPGRVIGDPARLRQILANIIGNAIKFTDSGSIDISATTAEKRGDESVILVAVRDTGIGIPEDKLGDIFQTFQQGDTSTTRRYGGTGLGAAISRRLARLMGGDIGIESTPGEGTLVSIAIPFRPAAADTGEVVHADAGRPLRSLTVLIAEDNLSNQRLIVDTLALSGHHPLVAGNGEEAVELWDRGGIDLILMDMRMPLLDGPEAAKIIRTREWESGRSRVPIIAVTANAEVEERSRCLDAGMDDFLPKPVTPGRLLETISHLFVGAASELPKGEEGETEPSGLFDPDMLGPLLNDPKRLKQYLVLFGKDLTRIAGELRSAVERRDFALLARAAHSLKGVARPLRDAHLASLGERLCEEARGSDGGGASLTTSRILEEVDAVLGLLEGL